MIRDVGSIDSDAVLRADVCIVGAGPAGITVARQLSAQGVSVCLLESGGLHLEPEPQELSDARSVGQPYLPLGEGGARVRAFGGCSRHWETNGPFRGRPLDPIDFEARPGIPDSGWPITATDLEPYYATANKYCKLSDLDYEPETWHRPHELAAPFPDNTVEVRPFQLSESDWLHHSEPIRTDPLIDLVLHATVTSINTDDYPETVSSVTVRAGAQHSFTVVAEHTILAAHAIENARMLLAGNPDHPGGIGNQYDLVGRYFQDHLAVQAGVFRPAAGLLDSPLLDPFFTQPSHVPDVRVCSMLGLAPELVRREEILNPSFFLYRTTEALSSPAFQSVRTLGRFRSYSPGPPDVKAHLAQIAKKPGAVVRAALESAGMTQRNDRIRLLSMTEQAPNRNSRVLLNGETDRFGVPKAVLDWRLSDLDHQSISRSIELIDRTFREIGWGHIEEQYGRTEPRPVPWGSFHQLGTTRMAADARHGVVDANLAVFGMRNLYSVGGSVFSGGGYANPTLTIVALAARLADHLTERLRGPARIQTSSAP